MRITVLLAATILVAVPAAAQDHAQHGQHTTVSEAHLPAGWQIRLDRDAAATGIHAAAEGNALRVRTGPAVVFYNPEWKRSGNYKAAARLTQMRPSAHPEGYGLVIGGRDLKGAGQSYTYFLVRSTGEFFIATRNGAERTKLVDWTPSAAIRKPGDKGRAENRLSVAVRGDEVVFAVNGTEVARRPRNAVRVDGIHGYRVNHNLDVRIQPEEAVKK